MCALVNDEENGFSILPRPWMMLEGGRWHHLTNRIALNL